MVGLIQLHKDPRLLKSHRTIAVTGLRDNCLYQACPLCDCQRLHAEAVTHEHESLYSAINPAMVVSRFSGALIPTRRILATRGAQ
ncbi:hypothetical protein JOB18_003397, partial [Solea senegalensis]